MEEKDINRTVKNALIKNSGAAFKITDPHGAEVYSTVKNPFDGFGAFREEDGTVHPVYWESKWDRDLKAFNLKNHLQPHQADYLTAFSVVTDSICLVPYGTKASRKDTRIYFFLWDAVKDLYNGVEIKGKVKHSIPAKVLEKLPYAKVNASTWTCEIKRELFITKALLNSLLYE